MKTLRCLAISVLSVVFYAGCGDDVKVEKHPAGDTQTTPKSSDTSETPSSIERGSHPVSGPVGNAPKIASEEKTDEAGEPNTGELDFAGVQLTVPKTWIRKQPRSTMLMAEYAIPKAEADSADGRVTAMVAGGTIEDNVTRWEKQFGEKPDKETKENIDAGGVKVTLVDLSGTFGDSMGPMSPAVDRPNYRMLAAIFDVGGQLHFIKCTGPAKTMAANADAIKTFIKSIKTDSAGK